MTAEASVSAGARLHFGFANLSLAHTRLYGGLGVALAEPRTELTALPGSAVVCEHERARTFAQRACDLLDVSGATVRVEGTIPAHVGLGSGTALALATLTAVARAHDRSVDVRDLAPALGRGGRSGVGLALFQAGGFVLDGGHPTELFTPDAPAPGQWQVPPVVARHEVPADWRFLLVRPEATPGPSDAAEDDRMRSAVRTADPEPADRIAATIVRRLLPGIATGDRAAFGDAVAEIGRLNGSWYAAEQGGVYRAPARELVHELRRVSCLSGVGQSSWGPTVYGVTDASSTRSAERAGRNALASTGVDGTVAVVKPANDGARVRTR